MQLPHYLAEVLLILLTSSQLSRGLCNSSVHYMCELPLIDLRSDGMQKLQAAVASIGRPQVFLVQRLIVPTEASGTLLLRLVPLAQSLVYGVYREGVFLLPAGADFLELSLVRAPQLRSFRIGGPSRIRQLAIEESALDRVPPLVGQLAGLRSLSLVKGKLTALPLDVAFAAPELMLLNVAFNQISQLSMGGNSSSAGNSALRELILEGNRLEYLDLAVFAPLKLLDHLTLTGNRLKRLDSSKPTVLPALRTLIVDRNNLTALQWNPGFVLLPALRTLTLSKNAIEQLPANWSSLRALATLLLDGNRLTVLDMGAFRSLPTIYMLNLQHNQLEAVVSSGPPFTLPQLSFVNLAKNRIAKMNFAGCQLPHLQTFIVSDNRLAAVPARIFLQSPNVGCVIRNNPLKCASLLQFRSQLIARRLQPTLEPIAGQKCSNSSIPIKEINQIVCCER